MDSLQSYCKTKQMRLPAFDFYFTALEHYKVPIPGEALYCVNVNLFNVCLKSKYRNLKAIKKILKKHCSNVNTICSENDVIKLTDQTFCKIIRKFGDPKFVEFLIALVTYAIEYDRKRLIDKIESLAQ